MIREGFPVSRLRWATGAAAACALWLAACGGGGDGGGEVPVPVPRYVVSGTLEGLVGRVVLRSGAQQAIFNANGRFQLADVPAGTPYDIEVTQQPDNQTCSVRNGRGTVQADVSDIRVECRTHAYNVSGQVAGASGPLILQLNGGNPLQVATNGSFTFALALAAGQAYEVTLQAPPAGQACTIAGANGTAGTAGAALQVTCAAVPGPVPEPPAPPPIPSVPLNLTVSYGAKALVFAWGASADATAYQVLEDPDGPGPQPLAPLGAAVAAITTRWEVPGLLTNRLNARYALQACNVSGCSAASAQVQPDWARAIGYFKASNPGVNQYLGSVNTVALSADGSTMALGAYGEASNGSGPANTSMPDAGAVYIYVRNATGWVQQAYLKAPVPQPGDYFGKALALSADGSTLAIGADGEDSSHTGTFSVMPAHNTGNTESGAAYVYTRSGSSWSQQAFIKAANAGTFDLFGFSVALSGDGSTLAVGAYLEGSTDSGAAYVFTRSGSTWTQQALIRASNADANDWFGFKVALSFNGDTLAVTGYAEASATQADPADNSVTGAGAVYVFARSGATWSQQAYLKSTLPEAEDRFGNAIAISSDGNTLAISAQGDDSNRTGTFAVTPADNNLATNSGAVYVFTRAGAAWSQQAFLKSSNARTPHRFGHQLSLSGDGSLLAVGAYREDSAARGFNGDQALTGTANAGAAYLFSRTGAAWTQQAYLKAPNADAGDAFGIGIALSRDGTSLAIAADSEDSGATGVQGNAADNGTSNAGAVYLY